MTIARSPRLLSLDVFRGLVILAMLFVNDLTPVKGVPAWLLHAPTYHDGMTFVDLVFPAFLFMVGMAIPFALKRREAPWGHVLIRTASLAFLGFMEITGERMAPGGLLSPDVWYVLEGVGIILVWNEHWKPSQARVLRWAGWGLLALCLCLFQGDNVHGPLALRPEWWGILGLIGWGYLSACLVYLPLKRHLWALPTGMALFLAYAALEQSGHLARVPGLGTPGSPLVTFAPHGAIVLAGAFLGQLLGRQDAPAARLRNVAAYGAVLFLASMLVHRLAPQHPIFILSKNLATVTWCLRSSAYAVFLWLGIHLVVDRAGWSRGTGLLREAGANALFAYFVAPVAVALLELLCLVAGHAEAYLHLADTFRWGLTRAVVHAILLTILAGVLRPRAIQLKI